MAGFGGAVKLTGESEYRKALASINQSLKEVDSEVKLVTSQYDKNDKSEKALAAETDALSKKYDAQAKKLQLMRDNYKSLSEQAEKQKEKHKALGDTLQSETEKLKKIADESGKTSEEYKKQAEKVNALSADYAKSEQAIVKNEQALSKARIELNNNEAALNKTALEIDKLQKEEEETTSATDKMGASLKDASKDADSAASGGISAFGVALGNLVADTIEAAIKALGELGKAAVDAFASFDEGRDTIIYATGATGEAAESLKKSYENVSKSIVADNADIGKAVGEIATRFGFTEGQLEDASVAFLKFSKITGTDVKSAVTSVSRAMEKTGMDGKDYNKMLDMLLKASQTTGVAVDRLSDSVTKYAIPMKNLGFDTKETIALFSQFEKTGVNVEQAFNGLQKAAANWAKDGKDASAEFEALMNSIKEAPTDIEATTAATEIFGTKTGPELAAAIRAGKLEVSDMVKTLQGSKGTLDSTFDGALDASDDMKLALQNVKTELGKTMDRLLVEYGPKITELINKVTPEIEKFLDNVVPTIEESVSWLVDNLPEIEVALSAIVGAMAGLWVAQKLMALTKAYQAWKVATEGQTVAQWLLNTAMLANPIMLLLTAITALTAGIVALALVNEDFREQLFETWDRIKEGAQITWEWICELVTETIPDALYNLGEFIVTKGSEVLTWIGMLPQRIGEYLGNILYKVKTWGTDTATAGLNAARDFFNNIVNKIKQIPGEFTSFITDSISEVVHFGERLYWEGQAAGQKLFSQIKNKVEQLPGEMLDIGKRLVEGLWDGIKSAGNWLEDKIGGFCDDVVDWCCSGFGIFSPSRVMRDRVGKYLAQGIGVGFEEEMKSVSEDMLDAIPSSYDISPEVSASGAGAYGSNYAELVRALKEALTTVDVVLDDRKLGQFVTRTITNEVYS